MELVFEPQTHDLMAVMPGYYKDAQAGGKTLSKAYAMLMEAVPEKK